MHNLTLYVKLDLEHCLDIYFLQAHCLGVYLVQLHKPSLDNKYTSILYSCLVQIQATNSVLSQTLVGATKVNADVLKKTGESCSLVRQCLSRADSLSMYDEKLLCKTIHQTIHNCTYTRFYGIFILFFSAEVNQYYYSYGECKFGVMITFMDHFEGSVQQQQMSYSFGLNQQTN